MDPEGVVTATLTSGSLVKWPVHQWPEGLRALFQPEYERLRGMADALEKAGLHVTEEEARRKFHDQPWAKWKIHRDGTVDVENRGEKRKFDTPRPALDYLRTSVPFIGADMFSRPLIKLRKARPSAIYSERDLSGEPGGGKKKSKTSH